MKKLLIVMLALIAMLALLESCSKQKIEKPSISAQRIENMNAVQAKERVLATPVILDVSKMKAAQVLANEKRGGNGNGNGNNGGGSNSTTARVEGNLVNIGVTPIIGTFSVSRGPVEDTLILTIINWGGLWWDYHYNYGAPTFQIVPGCQGSTNYYLNGSTPDAFPWIKIVPHGGLSASYFAGVSSVDNTGNPVNVAGLTIVVTN